MENSLLRPVISLVLGLGVALVALIAPAPSVAGAPARPAVKPTLKVFSPDNE
jgi:hypothetical protein